jgi:hypothetical protein
MSRPQEAHKRFVKTGEFVYNITIESSKSMSSIVDSMKGIENIFIDSKELGPGKYDFILSFGARDDKSFGEKIGELKEILNGDFPGNYCIVSMQKCKLWPGQTCLRPNIY